ncbi:MAG: hypothetical protein JWM20_904 [Patescibacteria group bacterium]|nr:hypothetical protein [Patescibacteria group bacterium]
MKKITNLQIALWMELLPAEVSGMIRQSNEDDLVKFLKGDSVDTLLLLDICKEGVAQSYAAELQLVEMLPAFLEQEKKLTAQVAELKFGIPHPDEKFWNTGCGLVKLLCETCKVKEWNTAGGHKVASLFETKDFYVEFQPTWISMVVGGGIFFKPPTSKLGLLEILVAVENLKELGMTGIRQRGN